MLLFLATLRGVLDHLSAEYRRHIDEEANTFTCFTDGKTTPFAKLIDGECDCCDGSDEFQNMTFCHKTCPLTLSSLERGAFRRLYNRAIVARSAIGVENDASFHRLEQEVVSMKRTVNDTRAALDSANAQLNSAEASLRAWVYRTTGVDPPDAAAEKAARKRYINRLDHVRARRPREGDEQSEEDAIELDEDDFRRRRERRKTKWKNRREDEYETLLRRALERAQPSVPGVLGKFRAPVHAAARPAEYEAVIAARGAVSDARLSYTNLLNDIRNAEERLAMDLGQDHVWFDATERSVSGPVAGTDRTLVIEWMRRALLRLPSTGCAVLKSLGKFAGRSQHAMHFAGGHLEDDGAKLSLMIRLVCFPEEMLIHARAPTVSRVVAVVGLPEACNTTYREEDFNNFLMELQEFKDEIIAENPL
jgi:hypothetical protein